MSNAYGVCATSAKYTPRVSLLIDVDGKIVETFEDIDPSSHADEALEKIRNLSL
jgi:peroxiredoxin